MKKINYKLLNKYFDGVLTDQEDKSIKKLIKSSESKSVEVSQLIRIHKSLQKIKPIEPSPSFTSNLMDIILQNSVKSTSKMSISNIFYFSFILVIILCGSVIYEYLDVYRIGFSQMLNHDLLSPLKNAMHVSTSENSSITFHCISALLFILLMLISEEIKNSIKIINKLKK